MEESKYFIRNKNIRKAVFNRDGKVCNECDDTYDLALDHIIPLSRGGKNHVDNLQVLCRSCNSKKGVKSIRNYNDIRL